MYPARLLLVDGRPEANMDCLDGPEVVLEGEEEVAAIFFGSPLPVRTGMDGGYTLSYISRIEHGSSHSEKSSWLVPASINHVSSLLT